LRLICVGTLQEPYKGQDVLIRAVAACVKMGDDVVLRLVGDGKTRPVLEKLAEGLSIRRRCDFRGEVNGLGAVVRELDDADVFVLPSRQEGVPRAMIEAMARGLPCIGTTVGGIPELLPPEDMVPPNDVAALARKIHDVTNSPERCQRMSSRNLETAQEYTEENLRERREHFYRYVKAVTASWQVRRIGLSA
jgi:glycosyltransferase involved in cell wall biosynthesis